MKTIGSRLGECEAPNFSIPSHIEEELSPTEIANRLASHFSAISQEYPPIDIDTIPQEFKVRLLILTL